MYALDVPSFCSGRLLAYLTDNLRVMGPAASVAVVLAGRVNWQRESGIGPRGTINGLTVKCIAELIGSSESTARAHLRKLRQLGIIKSEEVCNRRGGTIYCRFWFAGFLRWLSGPTKRGGNQVEIATPEGELDPAEATQGGGGENPAPIQEEKSKEFFIDLEAVSSVKFTELESVIRTEAPKTRDGGVADPELVFGRFRAWNLARGNARIRLSALRGFARKFVDGTRVAKRTEPPLPARINPPEKPDFGHSAAARVFEAVWTENPAVFQAWFAPLKVEQRGTAVVLRSPSSFHADYIRSQWGDLLRRLSPPGELIQLA